jgi:hypothetical protein
MTIEQVATVLCMAPPTVHGLLAGTGASAQDRKRIDAVLAVLRFVDRGSARGNAALLLSPLVGTATGIDMLREGRTDAFVAAAGQGPGRPEPLRVDRTRVPLRGEEPGGWLEAVQRAASLGATPEAAAVRGRTTKRVPFPQR